MLFEGPEGWTEFSPFAEYDDDEASAWLAAAIDYGWNAPPPPLRDRIPVNATVPAVDPDSVRAVLAMFPGCRTAKVKVASGDETLAADVARVRAVREALGPEVASASMPTAAGTWTRPSTPSMPSRRSTSSTWSSRGDDRPARRDQPAHEVHGHPDRGRRERAAVGRPARGGRVRRRRHHRRQGAAARRHPSCARIIADAGLPVVVSSALDTSVGLAMGPARGIRARARLRLRARHRGAAGGGCHARPARARGRVDRGAPRAAPTPSCSTGTPPTPSAPTGGSSGSGACTRSSRRKRRKRRQLLITPDGRRYPPLPTRATAPEAATDRRQTRPLYVRYATRPTVAAMRRMHASTSSHPM